MPKKEEGNKEYLFHYTDFRGLSGILESRCLRAYDVSSMNDTSELIFSLENLKKYIHKEIGADYEKEKEKRVYFNSTLDCLFYGLSSRLDEHLHVDVNGKKVFKGCYATSFCDPYCKDTSENNKYEHKNGLLSQWRGYGKGGGFAIKFDKAKILEMSKKIIQVEQTNLKSAKKGKSQGIKIDGLPIYGKVDYFDDIFDYDKYKKLLESRIEDIQEMCSANIVDQVKEMVDFLKKFLLNLKSNDGNGIEGGWYSDNFSELVGKINIFAMVYLLIMMKHVGFREENEYRIAIPEANLNGADNSEVKFEVSGTGRVRSYMELFKDARYNFLDSIDEILIGPSHHKNHNALMIERLIKQSGLEKKVSISASRTPFV